MARKFGLAFALLIPLADSIAQTLQAPIVPFYDESNLRPPVTPVDLQIALRAKQILNRPEKWDQSDTRLCRVKACTNGCPILATTFSLYCALERATEEVTGGFEHRGAVMQEARFVIDEIAANRNDFQHRLEGFNNSPNTTFDDIQKVLLLLEE